MPWRADHQMYAAPTSAAARYSGVPDSFALSLVRPAGVWMMAAISSTRLLRVKSVPGSRRNSR